MKTILIHLSLFLFLLIVEAAEPEKSVIQIFTFSQEPDWDEPWNSSQVRRATGSGFVIEGNRIMTNAHVVSWAKQIMVRRFQDSRPHLAQVAYVGHDCDLALLEVEDETFFEGLKPLSIGVLPEVRSVVNTIGYPAGGEQISYTSGVVSRVELINYVQPGNRSLLAV
ncbi:MAG: trypsin-like peptidase domain-containing protein, partial [Verrucomicrobia bacterium]|nr:trypsin-like peptidase domain-containing protein [Verrucomicrobiota bacterium]